MYVIQSTYQNAHLHPGTRMQQILHITLGPRQIPERHKPNRLQSKKAVKRLN
jgi:hypothetical protein